MKGYRGVIFDLDGTLLDSLQGIADAMNGLLQSMSYPCHSLESYKYFVGDGLKELIRRALPGEWFEQFDEKEGEETALDDLLVEYRKLYDKTWPLLSPPYPGIGETLDKLSENQVKMAILSNKTDDFTRRMVQTLLPNWEFIAVVGARPGFPLKPDPGAALEIARQFALPPGSIAFIGDTAIDMQTGVNAGMNPVGVLWGFRTARELQDNGALHLVLHPAQLLEILLA